MSQAATTAGATTGEHDGARAPKAWSRGVGYLAGLILGAVLLIAAWTKLLDPVSFAETIRGEGLDFLLSAEIVALIAVALEVALGAALVLGVRQRFVLWPSVALVVFFLFLTGRTYLRAIQGTLPNDAGCGCFGNLVERTPAEAFWQDLVLLGVPVVFAFLGRRRRVGVPQVRTAIIATLTAAALLLSWMAPELPLDNLATRLKPGASIAALCSGAGDDRVCLDGVVPELSVGEHLVILTGLDEASFVDALETLNERHWAGDGPPLWVVTAASDDERFQFRFSHAPAFEPMVAPASLLAALYRTLPRSFTVVDGVVTETWSGLPPLTATNATHLASD